MRTENPFGGGKKAPYVPQYGAADFPYILSEAGLDQSKFGTEEFLARGGIGALFELFSDGEIIVQPASLPLSASSLPSQERHGYFYAKMSELLEKSKQNPGSQIDREMNKLARFAGSAYAEEAKTGNLPVGAKSEVQPFMQQGIGIIEFAGQKIPVEDSVILDIGPGVLGRQFLELQAKMLLQGRIFQYIGVSNGPFVNEFLLVYGEHIFDQYPKLKGFFKAHLKRGFFVGREDGFSRAMDELTPAVSATNGEVAIDIAICNGLGEADANELEDGLSRIHEVIRPGGRLLLGAPVDKIKPNTLNFAEQMALVSDDFEVKSQITRESGLAIAGRNTTSTFAVLTKK